MKLPRRINITTYSPYSIRATFESQVDPKDKAESPSQRRNKCPPYMTPDAKPTALYRRNDRRACSALYSNGFPFLHTGKLLKPLLKNLRTLGVCKLLNGCWLHHRSFLPDFGVPCHRLSAIKPDHPVGRATDRTSSFVRLARFRCQLM